MITRPTLVAALAVLALAACGPHRIPGTEIRDTPETRAVFEAVQTYAQAMQAKDAQKVLSLVGPDYFDAAGTPDPVDDIDRGRLEQSLAKDFSQIEGLRLELTIRDIQVEGEQAYAEVFYDTYYRVQTPQGPVPRHDSDVHRISFKRESGTWKIVSGI